MTAAAGTTPTPKKLPQNELITEGLKWRWNEMAQDGLRIIRVLGLCRVVSGSPNAAGIVLEKATELEYNSLFVNIIRQIHLGEDAFLKSYADMERISMRAHELGKKGGPIDDIVEGYGVPKYRRAVIRAMKKLGSDIKSSKGAGDLTKEKFGEWRKETERFMMALTVEIASNNNEVSKKQGEKRDKERERDQATNDKNEAEKTAESAETEFQKEKRKRDEMIADSRSFLRRVGSFLGFEMSKPDEAAQTNFQNQARIVKEAQDRVDKTVANLRSCVRNVNEKGNEVSEAELKVENCNTISTQLSKSLAGLEELQKHITTLVMLFTKITLVLESLLNTYSDKIKEISESSDPDDDAEMIEFERGKLVEASDEARAYALLVWSLTKFYSKVSEKYLLGGFQMVSSLGSNVSGIPEEEHFDRVDGDMKKFESDAFKDIRQLELEYKFKLSSEVQRLYPGLAESDAPGEPNAGAQDRC